ncbi:hypothetical protein [Scytonema hofmannii]|uniref:hypothetical protein n=1 Tax=Scytonema hofmannii TaxID=34078 RepID=UPI0003457FB6|nr:hypothetical protein [Scytonema hofmannii]
MHCRQGFQNCRERYAQKAIARLIRQLLASEEPAEVVTREGGAIGQPTRLSLPSANL